MGKLDHYLQNNVIKYCETLTDKELLDLALFLGGGYYSNEPNPKITKFINDFIGTNDWKEFDELEIKKSRTSYFSNIRRTAGSISELYAFISFQFLTRSRDNKKQDTGRFKKKLSTELEGAIENSFDGDIFYKADAFSNIADVLTKHKLIDLTKYDKDED